MAERKKGTEVLVSIKELDKIKEAFELIKSTHGSFMFRHDPVLRDAEQRLRSMYARRTIH